MIKALVLPLVLYPLWANPPDSFKTAPHKLRKNRCPFKCEDCTRIVDNMMDYLLDNINNMRRPTEIFFSGMAAIATGNTMLKGDHSKLVERAVKFFLTTDFNKSWFQQFSNWYYALSTIFLSHIQITEPDPVIEKRLEELVNAIIDAQTVDGGWSHKKGFVYQHEWGSIKDLSVTSAYCHLALTMAQKAGISVDKKVLKKSYNYFTRVFDGTGFNYGLGSSSNHRVDYHPIGRGAIGLLAFTMAGMRDSITSALKTSVSRHYKHVLDGHALTALHVFAAGNALYLTSRKSYLSFINHFSGDIFYDIHDPENYYIFGNGATGKYERDNFKSNFVSVATAVIIMSLPEGNLWHLR